MTKYYIKQATKKEKPIIEYLDKEIFPYDERIVVKGSIWWLVLSALNYPVGFAGITSKIKNDYVFFCRAGILPAYRIKGLHKRLIRTRLNYSKRMNYKQAITYTLLNNNKSSNNLISEGFKLYTPGWKWAGSINVLYWYKDL